MMGTNSSQLQETTSLDQIGFLDITQNYAKTNENSNF